MTCFSPLDRRAFYEALARDAAVKALGCTDARMRQSLELIAEHWTALTLLCASVQDLQPESLMGGRSSRQDELRERYNLTPGKTPEPDGAAGTRPAIAVRPDAKQNRFSGRCLLV